MDNSCENKQFAPLGCKSKGAGLEISIPLIIIRIYWCPIKIS